MEFELHPATWSLIPVKVLIPPSCVGSFWELPQKLPRASQVLFHLRAEQSNRKSGLIESNRKSCQLWNFRQTTSPSPSPSLYKGKKTTYISANIFLMGSKVETRRVVESSLAQCLVMEDKWNFSRSISPPLLCFIYTRVPVINRYGVDDGMPGNG